MGNEEMVRIFSTQEDDFLKQFSLLLTGEESVRLQVEEVVSSIIREVRLKGDAALLQYTEAFDSHTVADFSALCISREEMRAAWERVSSTQRELLQYAVGRIRRFHLLQQQQSWSTQEEGGGSMGQVIMPLSRVGVYVPGGQAVYPSSVLMNVIPAVVAGVGQVVMVSPTPQGMRDDFLLSAAYISGVHQVFCIGGAQAIAALAYGTEHVARVDKITGPGNAYVAEAKRQVFGRVGIDMVAGPSEILVIADGSVDPKWAAADLLGQAEHDERAQAILLCPHLEYLEQVKACILDLLPSLLRRQVVERSLQDRSALIQVRDFSEACALANQMAPEHLELLGPEAEVLLPRIHNAGAIFVGAYSCEVLADYCAGPNHVLPTAGSARFSSPLGVQDFQKATNVLQLSSVSAAPIAGYAQQFANYEGLTAHALSASLRIQK